MFRFFRAFLLAIALIAAPVSTAIPFAGSQVAQAGLLKKGVVIYAVAKALQFGGRAVVRKVVDLSKDPRVRQHIVDYILDLVTEDPALAQKADDLLQAIGENMSLSEHLASRAPALADAIETLPEVLPEVFAENQMPYSPGIGRKLAGLAGDVIASRTIPEQGPNLRLAGQSKWLEVDGQQVQVTFDQRGYAVFDDYSMFDTRIEEISDRRSDFKAATSNLRESLRENPRLRSKFTDNQLLDIERGDAKIEDLTWHHHQDCGRLQLVATALHKAVAHVGGFAVCLE